MSVPWWRDRRFWDGVAAGVVFAHLLGVPAVIVIAVWLEYGGIAAGYTLWALVNGLLLPGSLRQLRRRWSRED